LGRVAGDEDSLLVAAATRRETVLLKHVLLALAALCVGAALAGSASAAVAARGVRKPVGHGSYQYSDAFADWIVEQHNRDNDFFNKARKRYYDMTHS
jgi:hypothetical protein